MRVQSTFCDRAIAMAPHGTWVKPNAPELPGVNADPAKPAELASRTVNFTELSGAEYVTVLSSTGLACQSVCLVIFRPGVCPLCSSTKPFVLMPSAGDVCVAFQREVSGFGSG